MKKSFSKCFMLALGLLAITTGSFANDLSTQISKLDTDQLPLPTNATNTILGNLYNQYMQYFHSKIDFNTLIVGGEYPSKVKYGLDALPNVKTMNLPEVIQPHDYNGDLTKVNGIDGIPEKFNFVVLEYLPNYIYNEGDSKVFKNITTLLKDNGVLLVIGSELPLNHVNKKLKTIGLEIELVRPICTDNSKALIKYLGFYTIKSIPPVERDSDTDGGDTSDGD